MLDNLDREIELGQTAIVSIAHHNEAYICVGKVVKLMPETQAVHVQSIAPSWSGAHPIHTAHHRELIVVDQQALDTIMLLKLTY